MVPIILLTLLYVGTFADYDCTCNYAVEVMVHSQPTEQSNAIGFMYEFDCKPSVELPNTPTDWTTVAFEHMVGYIKKDPNQELTVLQVCPGSPPEADTIILSTHAAIEIPTTTDSATLTYSTTTLMHSTVATTTNPRTEATTPTISTATKPVATIKTTTAPPSSTMTSHITTHTTPTTHTTTTTTAKPTTAQSIATQSETRLPIGTTHRLMAAITTLQPIIGNVQLCPRVLHRYTQEDQGALTQYGDYCYELVPIRAIWSKAEGDCRAKGGHLLHISSQALQEYIYRWYKSFNLDYAFWIGLQDIINEEYFEWVSGDHLIYTNWYPDRYGNLASHHIEDCVLMVPYAPYFGQWDDVQCGITTMFGDSGQQNPFICEYLIGHPSQPDIIIG